MMVIVQGPKFKKVFKKKHPKTNMAGWKNHVCSIGNTVHLHS